MSGGLKTLLCAALLLGAQIAVPSAQADEPQAATTTTAAPIIPSARYTDKVKGLERGPDTVTFTADVVRDGGQPVVDQTVVLERAFPGEDFEVVASRVTSVSGHVTTEEPVQGSARYRWEYWGSYEDLPSVSDEVQLVATRDFNTGVKRTAKRVSLRGQINPDWDGRKVTVQRSTCKTCAWKTTDHVRTNAKGKWRVDVARASKHGRTWYYRAVVPADGNFAKSTSVVVKVPHRR